MNTYGIVYRYGMYDVVCLAPNGTYYTCTSADTIDKALQSVSSYAGTPMMLPLVPAP